VAVENARYFIGKQSENLPRWVLMYLAQEVCGLKLRQIADYLGLARTGSIPTTVTKLRCKMKEDSRLAMRVGRIKSQYDT
jgi:chromosomal replication initiation ATPase DnaA